VMIRVSDGELLVQNVVAKLQRLIPGGWVCNMEAVGNNSFRTVFASRAKLLRMVEWGIGHSKFQNAKLKIEESMVDNEVRYVFTKGMGPIYWVVGTSSRLFDNLGGWSNSRVTKDVDMVFTRRFDIYHLMYCL
jgi:hypothetical protein